MASPICYIVPPYLLQSIAECDSNPESCRLAAQRSLEQSETYTTHRHDRLESLAQPRALQAHNPAPPSRQAIVPEILLRHIAESDNVDDETRARAAHDAEHIHGVTTAYQRALVADQPQISPDDATLAGPTDKKKKKTPSDGFYRAVHDAKNDPDMEDLPGAVVRVEGQAAVADAASNEAYENVGKVLAFYLDKFGWKSIDGHNMHVRSTVHFDKDYENAFWDPTRMQMVFGDGHEFLYKFTGCLDVIGHELAHAVTEHTSPLIYHGQSGALNEHVSDVFGIMVKQLIEDEPADKADWLIGEGCLLPGVKGVALRNMKEPGTAYDDPRFGKDPQPAHFSQFRKTMSDNGGVHIFSGIPNRAFYLAAVKFGGYSWEKAGQIWWKTMTSGRVPPRCNFLQFADVTTDVAEEEFGEEAAKIVREAWSEVGVVRKV